LFLKLLSAALSKNFDEKNVAVSVFLRSAESAGIGEVLLRISEALAVPTASRVMAADHRAQMQSL